MSHNPENKECKAPLMAKAGLPVEINCTCSEQKPVPLHTCCGHCGKYGHAPHSDGCEMPELMQGEEGWVEELEVEHLERLFFLLEMAHLAKDPKAHMDEVRGEVTALKSFISSLLTSHTQRLKAELLAGIGENKPDGSQEDIGGNQVRDEFREFVERLFDNSTPR